MKLSPEPNPATYQIISLDHQQISLYNNKTQEKDTYTQSLIVYPNQAPYLISDLNSVTQLSAALFQQWKQNGLIDKNLTDIFLIGTGERHQQIAPNIYYPLIEVGIGCDCMQSGAAARTFSVLSTENRKIAALFVLNP